MARKKLKTAEKIRMKDGPSMVKYISMFLIILTVLIFLLMIFKKLDPLAFWIWMVLLALAAYKGIPYLRKKGI